MEISRAVEVIKAHNKWRRGDDSDMGNPREISAALDTLVEEVEKLQNTLNTVMTIICDDSIAVTHQSIKEYRKSIIRAIAYRCSNT